MKKRKYKSNLVGKFYINGKAVVIDKDFGNFINPYSEMIKIKIYKIPRK